jgi:hypothetical protein
MEKMTKYNPVDRICLRKIQTHPWVVSKDLPNEENFKKEMTSRM